MAILHLPFAWKTVPLVILFIGLAGCGGTKILDDPVPLTLEQSLATSNSDHIEVFLDWIIVRDGPGTWAREADWDEYLIRVNNYSAVKLSVTSVVAFDSMLTRHQSSGQRRELVDGSRQTARRYADQEIEVKAGMGGGILIAAGAVGGATAISAGAAALYMSSAAATATLGLLLAAPVQVDGSNESHVLELDTRATLEGLHLVRGQR